MGYLNVARVLIGRPPKVVSKYTDKEGYVWARDPEGFYFKSWRVAEEDHEDSHSLTLHTERVPLMASEVAEDVKRALETNGAGFSADNGAQDFVDRWSYQKLIKRKESIFG